MRLISALLIGAIFGLGIAISGMANPAKVLNFFDLAGNWDPSLIFVMGGALLVTAIGYRIVFATKSNPVFGEGFALPTRKDIDTKLVGGAAIFGVGWGIAGFCPGASIPALGLGTSEPFLFLVGVSCGIILARSINTRIPSKTIFAPKA